MKANPSPFSDKDVEATFLNLLAIASEAIAPEPKEKLWTSSDHDVVSFATKIADSLPSAHSTTPPQR